MRTMLDRIILASKDHSSHPTVVEYGAREMMKGKTPATAAKSTTKKLSGFPNLMIDPLMVNIDPKKLEAELWKRLVGMVIQYIGNVRPGKEDIALLSALDFFKQKDPKVAALLKLKVIQEMGRDPFPPA